MVKITFPDGSVREYEQGVTGLQIAESISPALARNVVSCGVNGETVELNRPINEDATVELYKFDDEQGKHTFWHTSAHLLAEALQELYPGIQFGFGPAIDNGFFYDVMPAKGQVISENDFPKIEKKMMELAKKDEPVVRRDVSKADAVEEFKAAGQTYKVEHIEQDLEDGTISTYTQGNFTDLCRGPHLMSTGAIKAMIGGRKISGRMLYNRATAPRQPGSSIKPIAVYAAALQKSYELEKEGETFPLVDTGFDKQGTKLWGDYITAGSIVVDEPTKINGRIWPKNSYNSYRGAYTFRTALQQSVNVCAVKILAQVGVDYSYDIAEKFGLTTDLAELSYLSLGTVNFIGILRNLCHHFVAVLCAPEKILFYKNVILHFFVISHNKTEFFVFLKGSDNFNRVSLQDFGYNPFFGTRPKIWRQ